jgi:hypothetical protein
MAVGKLYWACVPDPPLLHPSVWSRPGVLATSNSTQLLVFPWSESKKYSKLVNDTAMCQDLFVLLEIVPMLDVFFVDPQTWRKSISKTIVQTLGWKCLCLRLDKLPCLGFLDLVRQRTQRLSNLS